MIEFGEEFTCEHGEVPGDCPKCPEALSDLGNARRLVAKYGRKLRHVPVWRKWLVWDGTRWAMDRTGEAHRSAKAIVRPLANGMRFAARRVSDEKGRNALLRAAKGLESANGIRAMLELAATEEEVALAPEQLDQHHDLLNVENGTLDLRTFELSGHDPSLLLTKVARCGYDPAAEAPEFSAFLERIQPDPAMRSFLQRLFGQALSGRVTEHILPILHGQGANGKSRFTEVIRRLMGDYAAPVDPGLLIDRGEAHPTGVADLFGLRLALTSETDKGRRLAEGTIKRLTGGDEITARRMREDFWTFTPTHSIVMVTNHAPVVTGTDEGIWRRLRVVPFDVVIPANERTPQDVLDALLYAERDGILRWMVEGYRRYLDVGLDEPAAVVESTDKYRADTDMLALFISERCFVGQGFTAASRELFTAWTKWCEPLNIPPGSEVTFARAMQDKGYDNSRRTARGKVWAGVGLQDDD